MREKNKIVTGRVDHDSNTKRHSAREKTLRLRGVKFSAEEKKAKSIRKRSERLQTTNMDVEKF